MKNELDAKKSAKLVKLVALSSPLAMLVHLALDWNTNLLSIILPMLINTVVWAAFLFFVAKNIQQQSPWARWVLLVIVFIQFFGVLALPLNFAQASLSSSLLAVSFFLLARALFLVFQDEVQDFDLNAFKAKVKKELTLE